jgi:large subunit ribosomal protein L20
MARVKGGVTSRARHKKILKMAEGYRGRTSKCFRLALPRVEKALQYAYRDRRARKRDMRALWIQRINAASRLDGVSYGEFVHGLKVLKIDLNRKILSDMAVVDPKSFSYLVHRVKETVACRLVVM